MSLQVTHDPALGHRLSFHSTVEDGRDVMLVEMWVDPGGGVPPHIHPALEERFEVLSGRPEFLAGRKWAVAAPGAVVVVPPGVRHAYRNRGDEQAHVVCRATPPSTLQEFLEAAAAMSRAGKLTRHGLPTSPRAFREALALTKRHQDMVIMSFPPMPPLPVQRLLWAVTRTA